MNILISIMVLAFSGSVHSSDHIDGVVTREDKRADLSDLYAFPTEGTQNKLNLILNTYPFVIDGHFDSKVEYEFLIKQAELVNDVIEQGELKTINCSFITPHDHAKAHTMTCKSSNDFLVKTTFNGEYSVNNKSGMKAYAGKRSDPFFINIDYAKTLSKGELPKDGNYPDGSTGLNVLSIALEVDLDKLFSRSSDIYLISAQSIANDGSSLNKRVLDRVGRAEITNISLSDKSNIELRDSYNGENTFNLSGKKKAYKMRLMEKIDKYDLLDGVINWNYTSRQELVDLLLQDYLILDMSKECVKPGFLGIEEAILNKVKHQTCGGRKITDDIVDIMFTLYINKNSGVLIGDDAKGPHKVILKEFPYLREPTEGLLARIKAQFARWLEF